MPDIELAGVSRHNCRNLHLRIGDKEIFVIVGATGAGKTTLLNSIAGVTDYSGTVCIDGVDVNSKAPKKRGVGYLLQNLALFPHLTVAANIAFGLRTEGRDKKTIDERLSYLMEMMRIRHLENRYPHMLSGGEKKRIALARSLAPSPKILLLDEPTAGLDHQTAKYLRSELKSLLKRLEITTVQVTHDLREAEEIADRIAFMANGSIQQVSTPAALFFNPANECVSEFIGKPNIIECRQSRVLASGLVEVIAGDLRIVVPHENGRIRKIAIPPDGVYLSGTRPPGPALNRFTGRIEEVVSHNAMMRVRVLIGKSRLLSEMPATALEGLSLETGKEVHVVIKMGRLRYVMAG